MKMLPLLFWLASHLKYILLLLMGFIFIKWHWNRRKLYIASWNLDGGFSWPFIGNLPDIFRYRKNILKYAEYLTEHYHQPARFWMGPFFCVFIAEPNDLQIILNHPNALKKTFIYQFGEDFIGKCLLTAEPQIWRSRRKIIEPTFNVKILETYFAYFEQNADHLCNELEHKNGNTINVFHYISKCSINIISETAFDTKLDNSQNTTNINEMIEATDNVLDALLKRAVRLWLYPDQIFRKTKLYKQFLASVNIFHNYSEKVYTRKVKQWTEIIEENGNTKFVRNSPERFIDDLVYLQLTHNKNSKYELLTPTQIQREMNIMFAAGSDTSAHSISFVLLLLAIFKDVQEKVFEELEGLLSEMQSQGIQHIQREHLAKLEYMDQVINESMRLFPPTPLIARELTGPVKLSNGLILPESTTVGIGIYSVHRNRSVWGSDADEFNPDRFSIDKLKNMKNYPYSFIPFSAGSRNCIGLKFARFSMKVILLKIIKNFRIETDEVFKNIECEVAVLAKKIGGWNMKFIKR